MLVIAAHRLLDAAAFVTRFPKPLGEMASGGFSRWFAPDAAPPLRSSDEVRAAVRDLLRAGGYKPTGRGKPASEYLIRASAEGALGSIDAAVDACNVVSLHSGLPISVVDLDKAKAPLRIDLAAEGARYVFNASGQEIDLAGLLCLFDGEGPCANAVKDAQRTKTDAGTTSTLSIIWGTLALPGRAAEASTFYRSLLEEVGASTTDA